MSIDFTGYEETDVLQMILNKAKTLNVVYTKCNLSSDMADALVARNEIQYYNGRMLGVSFKQFPLIDPTKYDNYNGKGAMASVLKTLYDRTVI